MPQNCSCLHCVWARNPISYIVNENNLRKGTRKHIPSGADKLLVTKAGHGLSIPIKCFNILFRDVKKNIVSLIIFKNCSILVTTLQELRQRRRAV